MIFPVRKNKMRKWKDPEELEILMLMARRMNSKGDREESCRFVTTRSGL